MNSLISTHLTEFTHRIFFKYIKLSKGQLTHTTVWEYIDDNKKILTLDQLIHYCDEEMKKMLNKFIFKELNVFFYNHKVYNRKMNTLFKKILKNIHDFDCKSFKRCL